MLPLLLFAGAAADLPEFMAGCWDFADGETLTQECWMEPRAGLMLGASRESSNARLNSWEQLRIEQSADGKITLFASPGGRTPVPFDGRRLSPTAIEFTNGKHDYPQRIRYELRNDTLEAEISLIDGSKPMRWKYAREERQPTISSGLKK